MIISPFTLTSFLSLNLLKISTLVFVLVVVLKNKNINKSTDDVDLPPKFLGVDSITVIPSRLVKSIILESPKDKKLENKYGTLLPKFDELYEKFEYVNVKRNKFNEIFIRNIELMQMIFRSTQLEFAATSSEEAFNNAREHLISRLRSC